MASALMRNIGGSLDLANTINAETMRIINYFATHTVEKIIEHVDRMHIKDTGALKNSIRAVVFAQGMGKGALVSFFMAEYAPYVERALGRYYGVDADLQKHKGVAGANVSIPQGGYPPEPMTASFHDLPYAGGARHDALREKTHKPRQFLTREINRQVESISYRLLAEVGNTMEIHILDSIDDALNPLKTGNLWKANGYTIRTEDTNFPTGQTMDY